MKVFWILLGVLLGLLLLLFLGCALVFNQIVWRKTWHLPRFIEKWIAGSEMPDAYEADAKRQEEYFSTYPLEKVSLKTPDGATLRGQILEPKEKNGTLILACHGCRSSGFGEFCFMAPSLYKKGYTLLLPDHRGCGESDGKYMGFGTFESEDTLLWIDFLKERFPNMPIFLLGVSMGAATVLMMSDKVEDSAIRGIIADCSYTSAWDEFSYQMKTSFHLPEFPILPIVDGFCKRFCHYSFRDAAPIEHVKHAKKPILFIHGDKDDYVPFYMEKELFDACSTEKWYCVVEGAVHARSYYTNAEAYEQALEAFIKKCS